MEFLSFFSENPNFSLIFASKFLTLYDNM
jgi:hypothetical protein